MLLDMDIPDYIRSRPDDSDYAVGKSLADLTGMSRRQAEKRVHDVRALDELRGDGPLIVTLDIESAPFSSYHWALYDQNIGLEQIGTEWSILAFSAKWLGLDPILYWDTGGRGADKVRDDAELLGHVWNILNSADIVVAQNGKAFDLKRINARMVMAGMPPYSPVRVIDTMLAAKKHFDFSSNKLAWLTKHLTEGKKSEHRSFPGFELWKECLADNPAAWAEMRSYNETDVRTTEELYLKLRPWITDHPNISLYMEDEEVRCPKCGSTNLQRRGSAVSQTGTFQRFQCLDCGGWARSRTNETPTSKRKKLLA